MARTKHDPMSIVFTSRNGGTVVWTPGPHGQKHLRKVHPDDVPKVIDKIEAGLRTKLKGLSRIICDAVDDKVEERVEALVALEQGDTLATGGPSDKDNPSHPFGFPVHN